MKGRRGSIGEGRDVRQGGNEKQKKNWTLSADGRGLPRGKEGALSRAVIGEGVSTSHLHYVAEVSLFVGGLRGNQ